MLKYLNLNFQSKCMMHVRVFESLSHWTHFNWNAHVFLLIEAVFFLFSNHFRWRTVNSLNMCNDIVYLLLPHRLVQCAYKMPANLYAICQRCIFSDCLLLYHPSFWLRFLHFFADCFYLVVFVVVGVWASTVFCLCAMFLIVDILFCYSTLADIVLLR